MPIRLLIAAIVALGVGRPSLAQTARIAHLSHGGSAAMLDEAATLDNFGTPLPHFRVDSVRLLSDTTAVEYGNWHWTDLNEKTRLVRLGERTDAGTKQEAVWRYRNQYYPKLKVIELDSTAQPTAPVPATTVKKQKTKRKKSVFLPTVPTPSQHPGVALAVAAILTFASAGWLLGERRPRAQAA